MSTQERQEVRLEISKILIKWGMGTRQVAIIDILKLIEEREDKLRDNVRHELATLDWRHILEDAIRSRITSWGRDIVREWRNASDQLYVSMVDEAVIKKVFPDWIKEAQKGVDVSMASKDKGRKEKKKPKKDKKK